VTPLANPAVAYLNEPSIVAKLALLLKEIAPDVTRALVVGGPNWQQRGSRSFAPFLGEPAASVDMKIHHASFHDEAQTRRAIAALARRRMGGLIVPPDSFTAAHRALIIGLAASQRLPAVYFQRFFAVDGGLLSYGIDMVARFRRAAMSTAFSTAQSTRISRGGVGHI
jgi:hypothetical protein